MHHYSMHYWQAHGLGVFKSRVVVRAKALLGLGCINLRVLG